jgi:hypothetical protein
MFSFKMELSFHIEINSFYSFIDWSLLSLVVCSNTKPKVIYVYDGNNFLSDYKDEIDMYNFLINFI